MIAIPIHDEEGVLVAYAGRRLQPSEARELGKYRFPKGFRKELIVYNLDQAKTYQREQGLILVEGFFSVMKLAEAGFPNTVAVMGCEVSDAQARLMTDAKDVIVIFDGNDAGWSGAETARTMLSPRLPVRVVKLPPGREPEDLSPRMLRWLVNGMQALDLSNVSFAPRTTT